MEPKDLKNSEELKNPENKDIEKNEKETVTEKTETKAKKTSTKKASKTTKKDAAETKAKEVATETKKSVKEEKKVADKEQKESAVKKEQEATVAKEKSSDEDQTKEKSAEKEDSKKAETATTPEGNTGKETVVSEEKPEEQVKEEEPAETDAEKEKIVSAEKKDEPAETEVKSENAEKSEEATVKKEKIDYLTYTQIELVNALRDLLDEERYDIKEEVEAIKSAFYKKLHENTAEAKKKFIEEGGASEDFKAEEDPYENDIKNLLQRYRHIRIEHNKQLEQEKEENLKLKYEVIEKIKGLINSEESINKTFNEFRDLQHEWRQIGLVPQAKVKDLWETYHFHIEQFYDYIKINRELRDLDLKKNLETKIKLCESAEELLMEPSIIKAFKTLQKYHEQWREIGPVPREQRDDIWERFKAATAKINKKHQEFFDKRKEEQKKNLEAKTALCEKVEEINIAEIKTYKDWDTKSKELVELQKVWRTIGFAPKKDNTKIYERFRTACDSFFNAKREFYAKNKEQQQNNLQMKIDLCIQAEALKDSTDWKKTSQDMVEIQKKWKEIGPVPRKHSDSIWKRFRSACDYFFDKKSEHFSGMDSEQVENLKKKEELIEKVENFELTENVEENLKILRDIQRSWTEIGHVPFKKKDEIQVKFRDAINKIFDKMNIDEEKRNILKFRSKMTTYSESNRGQNKMRMERDKYMNKLKQLENDLVLLDNNIGFFAKSKNAESLIADLNKKIDNIKQKIELLKKKIRVIDEMDKE